MKENQESRSKMLMNRFLKNRESSLLIILLLVGLFLSFTTDTFFTWNGIMNLLRQTTLVTIIAAGQTFVISSDGIDLSVGQTMCLSSIVLALLLEAGVPLVIAMVVALVLGTFIGFVNGFLITRLNLPPFIITMATANVIKGFVLVLTRGYLVMLTNPTIIALGQGSIGKVPIMALFIPVVVIVCHLLLRKTVFGSQVRSIGANPVSARLSGIDVKATRVKVYALVGLLCGIAGIVITGRLNGGNPNAAGTYDMDSIAAVIVGGTSLSGGTGTVVGTLLGALLMGMIRNGLVLLEVNIYWQTVVVGIVIILICAIDGYLQSRSKNQALARSHVKRS